MIVTVKDGHYDDLFDANMKILHSQIYDELKTRGVNEFPRLKKDQAKMLTHLQMQEWDNEGWDDEERRTERAPVYSAPPLANRDLPTWF